MELSQQITWIQLDEQSLRSLHLLFIKETLPVALFVGSAGVHKMASLEQQKDDTKHFCGFLYNIFTEKEKLLKKKHANHM